MYSFDRKIVTNYFPWSKLEIYPSNNINAGSLLFSSMKNVICKLFKYCNVIIILFMDECIMKFILEIYCCAIIHYLHMLIHEINIKENTQGKTTLRKLCFQFLSH